MRLFAFLLCTMVLTISSCVKGSVDEDLTTVVVGQYTNSDSNTNMIVSKIDNSTVRINMSTGLGSSAYEVSFPNVSMTSATAFKMNAAESDDFECVGSMTVSGTGSVNDSTITLLLTMKGHGTGTQFDCSDMTDNITASK